MDLEAVRTELYGLPPDQFTATRGAQVKRARVEGDRALATEIGRLRKPTASAWLANLLARQRRDLLGELLALGEDLRAAQAALAGNDLRRLAAERHRLVSALVRAARQVAGEQGYRPSGAVEDEVIATLEAAVADPAAAVEVRSGQLVTTLRHSGFGWGDLPAGGTGLRLVAKPQADRTAKKAAGKPAARQPDKAGAAEAAEASARAARSAAEQARDTARAAAERAQADAQAAESRHEAAKALIVDLEGQLDRATQAATDKAGEAKAAGRASRVAGRRAEQAQSAVDRLG